MSSMSKVPNCRPFAREQQGCRNRWARLDQNRTLRGRTCVHLRTEIQQCMRTHGPPQRSPLERLLCSSRRNSDFTRALPWPAIGRGIFSPTRTIPIKPERAMARRQSEVCVRAAWCFRSATRYVRSIDRSVGRSFIPLGREIVDRRSSSIRRIISNHHGCSPSY